MLVFEFRFVFFFLTIKDKTGIDVEECCRIPVEQAIQIPVLSALNVLSEI